MQWIREWRIPQNYNEVQKFLGLVQYLARYMPGIMVYTTPLSGLPQNNRTFQWSPLLDKCFQSIKAIAMWLLYWSQWTLIEMNQYGSLQMVTEQESVWCMDKARTGTHVNQQDFYQRNSRAHSINTICTNTRHLRFWKLSWNGRINFQAESLQWSLTTKVLNTSRLNQACHRGRQGGGNILPASITIPSM